MFTRITALVIVLFIAPGAHAGDQLTFKAFSGYAAGKKCKGGMEGKDESVQGPKPSKHTWENPGDGWVMVAVAPELYGKLRGCSAKVGDKTIRVMDKCPACSKNGKIDMSHGECGQMGSNPQMPASLDWDCGGLDSRGRSKKLDPKNARDALPSVG